MKIFKQDTIITASQKKKEAIILLICFILANLLNLTAILIYKTALIELFTQWFKVLAITVVLFIILAAMRLTANFIRKLILKK